MSEIFAYRPSNAEWSDGYVYSIYDNELDDPLDVPNANDKIENAIETLDLDAYDKGDEHWIRILYNSIESGEPEQVRRDGTIA